jgi:signal transduction histidine kinase/HD-like signal output (HDOD) protein
MSTLELPVRLSTLDLVLSRIDSLPTLPPVAARLMQVGSADDADLDDVVMIIESDPALTSKVLGLCRCAAHGLGDRIATVRRAVVMLGIDAVRLAVLGVAVYELLGTERDANVLDDPTRDAGPSGEMDRTGFWRHSIATGCAAQLIAECHPGMRVGPDEAFTAGLLHGLGRLALDLILPRALGRALALAEQRRIDGALAERELLGIDHHTAGKRLAEHWGLPACLRDAIWLHAQPARALPDLPHSSLIGHVTVAKALCHRLHLGWSGDFSAPADLDAMCADFNLNPDRIREFVPELHERVGERCSLLGLERTTTPELMLQSLAGANRALSNASVQLERRSRATRAQAAQLKAIGEFLGAMQPGEGVARTLGRVVASAAGQLGDGFYGAIVQPAKRAPWRVLQIGANAKTRRDDTIEAPGDLSSIGSDLTLESIGLLPWLTDFAFDSVDVRRVRILRLGGSEVDGAAAMLMHDRPIEGTTLHAGAEPLVAAWWSAVRASIESERARRLGEELAASNRALAHAQDQIAESRAMVHLGQVAAGAAHEMNNPLTIISGRAQLLSESLSNARDRAAAAAIAESAQDLSDLISSLHMFASPPQVRSAPTSIGAIVRGAIELAEQRTRTTGRVRSRLAPDLPEGVLDRELVTRALAEVIVNALEASPSEIVEVKAQADPLDVRLLIVVEDRGPGLSAKALHHAFDPFFSEKPAGRQPGLGLARARQLIELHAGVIALRNNDGAGATCIISLPREQGASGLGLMHAA